MHAKIMMNRALSTIPSRPAIETALAESMDCLRLCRDDFIQWWATTAQGNYDFDNKELPYLDLHGADMTEELPNLRHKVFFASSIVYIKMMLAKEIKEAINAYELADRASLPTVVSDSLGDFLAPEGLPQGPEELKQLHTKLTSQLHEAFRQTHTQNQHFWSACWTRR
ncbi:hypothetical protein V7S43_009503 [Phytophthora oleae]|uniref:Uncharacterized protein n=1 Tax=Phytophthora oleae TaxID=2107226 RepID=A0ABD3FFB2_9STRA